VTKTRDATTDANRSGIIGSQAGRRPLRSARGSESRNWGVAVGIATEVAAAGAASRSRRPSRSHACGPWGRRASARSTSPGVVCRAGSRPRSTRAPAHKPQARRRDRRACAAMRASSCSTLLFWGPIQTTRRDRTKFRPSWRAVARADGLEPS
jgi:hypothetical protein